MKNISNDIKKIYKSFCLNDLLRKGYDVSTMFMFFNKLLSKGLIKPTDEAGYFTYAGDSQNMDDYLNECYRECSIDSDEFLSGKAELKIKLENDERVGVEATVFSSATPFTIIQQIADTDVNSLKPLFLIPSNSNSFYSDHVLNEAMCKFMLLMPNGLTLNVDFNKPLSQYDSIKSLSDKGRDIVFNVVLFS